MIKKILFIDDQEDIQEIVSDFLRNSGYEVYCASSVREAGLKLKKRVFNLVITDLLLPSRNGFEFIKTLRQENDLPVIIVTGGAAQTEHAQEIKLLKEQNYPCLQKPFSKNMLAAAVEKCIGKGL
jgi:DNA-binding response OmpR family regulator